MMEENRDLRFGWGPFKPKILQCLNGPKCFLVFLVLFSAMQGMTVNGFTKLVLPSIEKRFQFSGKELGVIAASNEASAIILVCFVSFFGGYGNKIRWLGYGAFITAFGCLLFVLPHFLVRSYYPAVSLSTKRSFTEQDLCHLENITASGSTECVSSFKSEWYYLLIFVCAQLLMGAGTTPLYSLGPAYIDENVHPKDMPIYLAFWFAASFLGPGIGFVIGGSFLSMFVDLEQPTGMNMNRDDPRWIGAWWLGFIIGGVVLVLSAFGLLAFPPKLPGTKEMREKAIREGDIPKKNEEIKGRIKDIFPATKNLLRNKTYVFNTLATSAGFFAGGISSFLPKILQDKFGVNASTTGFSIGAVIVPGMFIGVLLGGFVVRRYKVRESCRMAAKLLIIFSVVSMIGFTSWFIPGCNQITLAGVGKPYFNSTSSISGVDDACNLDCACPKSHFNPICGADDVTYFSPCHAGCQDTFGSHNYANCSCILPLANLTEKTAVQGFCDRGPGCKNFIAFLMLILVLLLTVFLKAVPTKTVVLRCVPDNQRAYALGLQFVFFRGLGSLPSPIFYGFLFDQNCVLWGESCGQRGNCLVYDIQTLSYYLAGCGFIFGAITFAFFFLSYWFYESTDELPRKAELIPSEENDIHNNANIASVGLDVPESPAREEDDNILKEDTSI